MREIVRRVDRLQRLAVFEAAARLGSFTAAAAELGMTQPAVTRQIHSLERSLGAELFARSANRSSLTDVGQRLSGHVGSGFDVIENGLAELADYAGNFVLASHPGIAQMLIVPRLDLLKTALGDLDLLLWLVDGDAELDNGTFDAAIRVGSGKFPGLDRKFLFPEVVVPIAAPGFAEQYGLGATSSAADVYTAPFVHLDDGIRPWMSWAAWLANFDITLRRSPGRVLFNNYPMVLQRALLGYGVALGWRPLIDEYVERGALVVVGPEVQTASGYYVTWPSGTASPAVTALIDWLIADDQLAIKPTSLDDS
jgi:LysR family glycine cleavage system transcriptional activator